MKSENVTVENSGKMIIYDKDSSPEAWEYYHKVHTTLFVEYRMGKPRLKGNRLLCDASKKGAKTYSLLRFGGETDFNFNTRRGHANTMRKILSKEGDDQVKKVYEEKLEQCMQCHHSQLNFSLMMTIGNLQGVKGQQNDRFDRFLYHLSEFFQGKSDKVLSRASNDNKSYLEDFLNFYKADPNKSLQDYCKHFLLLEDEEFIEKCVINGEKRFSDRESNLETVKNYIDYAQEYWKIKENVYRKVLREKMITTTA